MGSAAPKVNRRRAGACRRRLPFRCSFCHLFQGRVDIVKPVKSKPQSLLEFALSIIKTASNATLDSVLGDLRSLRTVIIFSKTGPEPESISEIKLL